MSIYISNGRILVRDSAGKTAFDTNNKMAAKIQTITVTKTFPGFSDTAKGTRNYLVATSPVTPDFLLATSKNIGSSSDTTTNWNTCGSLLDFVQYRYNSTRGDMVLASVISLWWSGRNIYLTQNYYADLSGASAPNRTLTFKIVVGVLR